MSVSVAPYTYPIQYDSEKLDEHVRGVAIPMFINNGGYHLVTLNVYEDGVADHWELIGVKDIQKSVDRGWITTAPPEAGRISIHNLGYCGVVDVQWNIPDADIARHVQQLFEMQNPQQTNLTDLDARRVRLAEIWNFPPDRISQSRMDEHIYRIDVNGQEIAGAEVPIFEANDGEFTLTRCFVYQDRLAKIGIQGELIPVEQIEALLKKKRLTTSVPDGALVTLPPLGRFKAKHMDGWYIKPRERWREVVDQLSALNGATDAVEACYQAFRAYHDDPTDERREYLREKYEAVPEHQRMYTQRDMDSKDHTIRRILYGKRRNAEHELED